MRKKKKKFSRCGQDSNLRGQSPLDFKSNSLTTRTPQLGNRPCVLQVYHQAMAVFTNNPSIYCHVYLLYFSVRFISFVLVRRSKTTKRKIDYNEAELVTCNSKARKIIQTPPTSENLNNDWSVDLKENLKINVNFAEKSDSSILKTALTKSQTMKRPVVNISNVWNNIHVQYI